VGNGHIRRETGIWDGDIDGDTHIKRLGTV